MVCRHRSITSNHKAQNDYRWFGGCRSFRFTALDFEGDASGSDEELVVDSESDEDPDEDDEDSEDEVVESERFLFLSTTHYL